MDAVITELRQLELDRQQHLAAIAAIDHRRLVLLELDTGTRKPARKMVDPAGRKALLKGSRIR